MILKGNVVGKITVFSSEGNVPRAIPMDTRPEFSFAMEALNELASLRVTPYDMFLDQLRFQDGEQ